jgi:hypothetical protein
MKRECYCDLKNIGKDSALVLGQKNEHRCIEWAIKENHFTEIDVIYNGTSGSNQ